MENENANNGEQKSVVDPTESYRKVVELLNDPKEVMAAAARLGLKVSSAQEQAKKEPAIAEPEVVELPEDAQPKDIIAAFNEALKRQREYLTTTHKAELENVKKSQIEAERAKQSQTIQQFAQKATHFKELFNDIEAFYNTGKFSIEEAYKKALKLNDKDDPKMGISFEKKSTTSEQDSFLKLTSPKLTDEASNSDEKVEKFANTQEAAKAKLREMVASDPKVAQLLTEENS